MSDLVVAYVIPVCIVIELISRDNVIKVFFCLITADVIPEISDLKEPYVVKLFENAVRYQLDRKSVM